MLEEQIIAGNIYEKVPVNSQNYQIEVRPAISYEGTHNLMVFILEDAQNGNTGVNRRTGLVIYTPQEGFSGTDSIAYEACIPGRSVCDNATIYLFVSDETTIVKDFKIVGESKKDVSISKIPFQSNFISFADKSLVTIRIGALPEKGTLYQDGNPVQEGQEIKSSSLALTYRPEDGFLGKDSFQWNGADEYGYALENAMVEIEIVAAYIAPFVQNINCTVDENDFYQFSLALFDAAYRDMYDDGLHYVRIEAIPEKGVLRCDNVNLRAGDSIAANDLNALAYQPDKDYIGMDAFEWRASNSRYFSSGSAKVNIEVMKVNEAPWLWHRNKAVEQLYYSLSTTEPLDFCLEFYDKHDDAVRISSFPESDGLLSRGEEDCFAFAGKTEPGLLQYAITICDDETPNMCREVFVNIEVKEVPPPPVYHNLSYTLLEGERLQDCVDYQGVFAATLSASLPDGFAWNANGCFEYTAPFAGAQMKTVEVSYCNEDEEYCDIFQLTIEVEALPSLVFYDGISPNGDGKNDSWIIENIRHYPENRIKIVSRWGELVYEATNYDNELVVWTGKSQVQNERLAAGVYYYDLELSGPYAGRFRGTILVKY